MKSITFSVLNFPRFLGWEDKWIRRGGSNQQLGVMEAETHDGWFVEVREIPDLMEKEKVLNRENGYAITHTGFAKRCDGSTFSVEDADRILENLHTFLSFSRGAACGLVHVKVDVADGRNTTLRWGTNYTAPWMCGGSTWLPFLTQRGHSLRQLFPRFSELSSKWKEDAISIIDWYLSGNTSGSVSSGIVSTQAALELLSHKMLQHQKRMDKRTTEGIEGMLRKMLEEKGIDISIPKSCEHLTKWSKSEETRKSCGAKGMLDGPAAIVKIRNDLVHADRQFRHTSLEVQIEALCLVLWYTEVILLKECGYSGPYKNRLTGDNEDVPS